MSLKYVGQHAPGIVGGYIPGIPARDLDDAEIRDLPLTKAQLIKTGLYEDDEAKPRRRGEE